LREGEFRDVSRARALLADAHETAAALGLTPLLRAITAAQQL